MLIPIFEGKYILAWNIALFVGVCSRTPEVTDLHQKLTFLKENLAPNPQRISKKHLIHHTEKGSIFHRRNNVWEWPETFTKMTGDQRAITGNLQAHVKQNVSVERQL